MSGVDWDFPDGSEQVPKEMQEFHEWLLLQDQSPEELDEFLVHNATAGIENHDLKSLYLYLRDSPVLNMHPALLCRLLGLLEGNVSPDSGEGMVLSLVKAPGAKRKPRPQHLTDKIRAHRIRAIVGFDQMNGWEPGCYESGMTNAAVVAGISLARAKQLLTPSYRRAIKMYMTYSFETKSRKLDNLLEGGMDFIVPAGRVMLAHRLDHSLWLKSL